VPAHGPIEVDTTSSPGYCCREAEGTWFIQLSDPLATCVTGLPVRCLHVENIRVPDHDRAVDDHIRNASRRQAILAGPARATAHALIQGYLGPDHKVIDMGVFFSALVQALKDAKENVKQ